jgi:hypothetical protein
MLEEDKICEEMYGVDDICDSIGKYLLIVSIGTVCLIISFRGGKRVNEKDPS